MSGADALAAAYRRAFLGDDGKPHLDGQMMLADLAAYCHAQATTARADLTGALDPLHLALLEGRRQAWLHLNRRLQGLPPAADAASRPAHVDSH